MLDELSRQFSNTVSGKTLFVLLGPTGVGKTDISIRLAQTLGCTIISSDSRQIYHELNIGVARPAEEQLRQVQHHFIANLSIHDHYSAGQYELDALPIIEQQLANSGSALMVGGSMLYIDAVCKGIDAIPEVDPQLREEVQVFYKREGIDAVRRQLRLLDPKHYQEVDLKNVKRMLHAIEVSLTIGRPFSDLRTNSVKQRPFNIVKIGLNRDRQTLYERINQRVEIMMGTGLEREAEGLYSARALNALNTVGYKELFAYFDGNYTKEDAIAKIQQNTRHYAKKQLSWFNKDKDIHWFQPDDEAQIIAFVNSTR